jgi:peptidoglycan/xylan/chitin deacetylase (PgdA/CDA1 family)
MRTLMYHDIAVRAQRDEVGFPGPLAARYKLEPDFFEAHLDALQATGLVLSADGLAREQPQVLLTFDDGGSSAMLIADALERRGWRGHFFVTTGRIASPGFLDAERVRELAARGHGVGSHSDTHPTYMARLSRSELDREWRVSREVLGELLGSAPTSASVPGGFLSSAVIAAAAAAGYERLFTSEPTARVRHAELEVRGRYTIWSSTRPAVAAAYASGRPLPCARLWLEWNAKKLAKTASPAAYQALRRIRARRS